MWVLCGHSPWLDTYIWVGFGRLVAKNRHQKDMSYDEMWLSAQNLLTILGSIVYTIGERLLDLLQEKENCHFDFI